MKRLSFVLLLLVSTALFATQADQEKIRIQDALNKGTGNIYFLPDVEMGNNQQLIEWSAGDGGLYSTDDISIGLDSDNDGIADAFNIYRDGATYGLGTLLYQLDNGGNVIHPINNQYIKWTGGYGALMSRAGFYLNLDYDDNATGEGFFIYKNSDTVGGGDKVFSVNEDGTQYIEGKIGIGSETPGSNLEVIKARTTNDLVTFYETSGANYNVLNIKSDSLGASAQKLINAESDSDGTPVERFSARGNGDVYINRFIGVGTTAPGYNLDIKSASSTAFINLNSGPTANSGVFFRENSVDKWGLVSETGTADDKLHIFNSASSKVITVLQDGNVGIGSETPTEKLDVNGNIKATALKTDSLLNSDGTGVPPGLMPIGGMIAVMPDIDSNAWQPPASGAIKDGFMRADGHQITAGNVASGCLFPEGTYLPNMVSMVARGGTASCDGSISCQSKSGGNDSITPSGTVSQPNFSGDSANRIDWFVNESVTATFGGSPTSYSVSVPAHYHGMGLGADLSTSLTANSPSVGNESNTHTHSISDGAHQHTEAFEFSWQHSGGFGEPWVSSGAGSGNRNFPHIGANGAHSHSVGNESSSHTHTVSLNHTHSSFSGSIGTVTGGSNGNSAFTASGNNTPSGTVTMDSTDDNKQEWSAGGTYTPTGTVSQPSFTGDSQSNLPDYQNVVWVIRVY